MNFGHNQLEQSDIPQINVQIYDEPDQGSFPTTPAGSVKSVRSRERYLDAVPSLTGAHIMPNRSDTLEPSPTLLKSATFNSIESTSQSLGHEPVSRHGTTYQQISAKEKQSWEVFNYLAKKHDRDMCYAWRDEIDKLLVFAGLFSAVVTAFITQSYKWLQPDPMTNTDELLILILQKISAGSPSDTVQNAVPGTIAKLTPSSSSVRINIAWFFSLVLSMSTVLIGISCAQWIREYQREAPLPHKKAFALRQMRFEGLQAWKVPGIMLALPHFLQLAVVLFFVGLVDFLWSLHHTVALVVSLPVGFVLLFMLVAALLPTVQFILIQGEHLRTPQCPYKSPQSLVALHIVAGILSFIRHKLSPPRLTSFGATHDSTWVNYDVQWHNVRAAEKVCGDIGSDSNDLHTIRGMAWIRETFTQSTEAVKSLLLAIRELDVDNATEFIIHTMADQNQAADRNFRSLLELSPDHDYRMDVISASLLKSCIYFHESLNSDYLRYTIQTMQATYFPGSLSHWDLSAVNFDTISDDMLKQLIGVIKVFLQKNTATTHDIETILGVAANLRKSNDYNKDWLKMDLFTGLFRALNQWLQSAQHDFDVRTKLKVCMKGLHGIAQAPFYSRGFNERRSKYEATIQSFALLLEKLVDKHGGSSVILDDKDGQAYMKEIMSLVRTENVQNSLQVLLSPSGPLDDSQRTGSKN